MKPYLRLVRPHTEFVSAAETERLHKQMADTKIAADKLSKLADEADVFTSTRIKCLAIELHGDIIDIGRRLRLGGAL